MQRAIISRVVVGRATLCGRHRQVGRLAATSNGLGGISAVPGAYGSISNNEWVGALNKSGAIGFGLFTVVVG